MHSFPQASVFSFPIFRINVAGVGLRVCGEEIVLVDGEWIGVAAVL